MTADDSNDGDSNAPRKSRTKMPGNRQAGPRRSGNHGIPWVQMRETYVCDETQTYGSIAKRFKVSDALIRRRAAQEDWFRQREDHLRTVVEMTRKRSLELLVESATGTVRDILGDTTRIRKMAIECAQRLLQVPNGQSLNDSEGRIEEKEVIPASVSPGESGSSGSFRGERTITKTKLMARPPIDSKLLLTLLSTERDIVLAILGKQGGENRESELRIE